MPALTTGARSRELPKVAKPGIETWSSISSYSFCSNCDSPHVTDLTVSNVLLSSQYNQNISEIILQDPTHLSPLEGHKDPFFAQIPFGKHKQLNRWQNFQKTFNNYLENLYKAIEYAK